MSIFSIRNKLILSFVGMCLTMIGAYVYFATKTFEDDKISYIYDTQQTQLDGVSKQINQKFDNLLFSSRAILAGYDATEKKLGPIGERLFQNQKETLAIEVVEQNTSESLFKLEKNSGLFDLAKADPAAGPQAASEDGTEVKSLGKNLFLITSAEHGANNEKFLIRIVVSFEELVTQLSQSQILLSQGDQLVNQDADGEGTQFADQILAEVSKDRSEKTALKNIGKRKFMISSIPLNYSGLRLTSAIDQDKALGALKILFKRSLLFVMISIFFTIIIAVYISSSLTFSLGILTKVAEKISTGDFSSKVDVSSKDEVGVLAKAFGKMSSEIQRLLSETKDKARMEQELKTAKLVQESLFPRESEFKSSSVELFGLFVTSSECGGDWWYYFERGDDVIIAIADATGHGTPAALITSAARAVFSQMETQNYSLEQMATFWDRCIGVCSNKKVLMTALLLQINRKTGQVRCINASHELPFLFKKSGDVYKSEVVLMPIGPRLGEKMGATYVAHEFQMDPTDRLLLYTDGLTGIENSEGKMLSEKRALKSMEKLCVSAESSKDLGQGIYNLYENFRAGHPLPDDVTLVILDRKAADAAELDSKAADAAKLDSKAAAAAEQVA